MSITTFTELKSSIADWLDRTDLTSVIPDFIRLAEDRMEQELRIIGMIKRSTASASSKYLALPSDYLEMRRLQLDTNPITVLTQVSPEELSLRFSETSNGQPRFFCIHEEIEFDRTPDKTYTAEIVYWAQLDRLSSSNTDNAILTSHPSIYLAASMAEACNYLHDDTNMAKWEAKYVSARDAANMRFRAGQYSRGPLRTSVDSPTP